MRKPLPLRVVVSYAPGDTELCDRLLTQLRPLSRVRYFEVWARRMLLPGDDYRAEIRAHYANADVVVLLLSNDYLADDSCFDEELPLAEAQQRAGASVFPVLLRPSNAYMPGMEPLWFEKIQAMPAPMRPSEEPREYQVVKPVTLWVDKDEAFTTVVAEMRRRIERARKG